MATAEPNKDNENEDQYQKGVDEMRKNVSKLKNVNDITEEAMDDDDFDLDDDYEQDDAPEYNTTELEAMKKGWNPDKESIPDGKEWVSAGEFLRNEKFFEEIHRLKRENKTNAEALKELKEHHLKVAEIEREKLLAGLKKQKKQALDEDDHDAVIEIDEKIDEIKQKSKASKSEEKAEEAVDNSTATEAEWKDAFDSWIPNNSWYNQDEDLREIADDLGQAYMAKNSKDGVEPEKLFEYVDKRMKKFLPDSGKPASKVVESGGKSRRASNKSGGAKRFTKRDLNADQRRAMKTFVAAGALTEEQYIADLVKIGELK